MIAKVAILCAVFAAAHSAAFLHAPIISTGVSSSARTQDAIGNYAFNYGIADGVGATNSRAEIGDAAGNKQGSYSLTDIDGRARRVDYVADAAGFRAAVNTNEPGTALSAPAAAAVISPYAGPVAPVAAAPAVAPVAPVLAAAPLAAYSNVIGHGVAAPLISTGVSNSARTQDAIGNYAFNYGIADGLGATNSRAEIGDAAGNKQGSYSLTDIDGRARRVDYVADAAGFRAAVNTNEPGTALSAPAAAAIVSPYAGPVAPVAAAPAVAPVAPILAAGAPLGLGLYGAPLAKSLYL